MPTEEQNLAQLPVVYANNVRVSLSFSDIKLFFAEFIPAGNNALTTEPQQTSGQLVDRVCITLSPDLIPAFINGLVNAIQTYQTQFGQLRPLPEIMLRPTAQAATNPEPPKSEAPKTWGNPIK
jgi:hypothetical protein